MQIDLEKTPTIQNRDVRLHNSQNVKAALSAFRRGEPSGQFFPSYYGIEVTRHCNLACVMCPHPQFASHQKGHMELDLFKRIVEAAAPYAEIVKLHWIGEPLLHPKLVEMIKFARVNLGASIFLSTNATFLEGELAERIRTAGLDKLIISLDGMSPGSYEAIRVKGNFAKVFANVEAFVNSVEQRGGPLCELQLITTNLNQHEVSLFQQQWSRYDSVAVNVTWLTDWAGNIPNRDLISDSQNPSSAFERQACSDLWFKMQISWTGEVNLCCLDAGGSVTLGNLRSESLNDIWQSPSIVARRRQQLQKRYSGICGNCRDWAQPQEYEFWYSRREYQEDPNRIWGVRNVPGMIQEATQ